METGLAATKRDYGSRLIPSARTVHVPSRGKPGAAPGGASSQPPASMASWNCLHTFKARLETVD